MSYSQERSSGLADGLKSPGNFKHKVSDSEAISKLKSSPSLRRMSRFAHGMCFSFFVWTGLQFLDLLQQP